MAFFRIDYYSNALHRATSFEMFIPNDPREPAGLPGNPGKGEKAEAQTMRTLFLLHGYTGKAENWVPEEVAVRYNLAVVMPTAENSFYLNGEATGRAYQTMVGEELVSYVRRTFGLAKKREETFIAGLSMGGFGALHTGLAYPKTFGKIVALSSALIVHEVAHLKPGEDNGVANYEYYRQCFGDLATAEKRDVNPEVQILNLKKKKVRIPDIFMACGTEDFLLENNRQLHAFLEQENVPHQYLEGPGVHNMVFWSEYIVRAIEWIFS